MHLSAALYELSGGRTDGDAARQSARVVVDAVVGDLQVMGPAIDVDAASGIAVSRWNEMVFPSRMDCSSPLMRQLIRPQMRPFFSVDAS